MAFNILKKAGYDDNISRKTEMIYSSLNKEYLGNRDIKILFCAHNAYLSLNMVSDVRLIAGRLNIPKDKISKVFTECSPIKTGYEFLQVRFSIKQYVLLYLNNLECLDYKQKETIFKIATSVEKNINEDSYSVLKTYKPQALAIALIMYYLNNSGESKSTLIFEEILYRPIKTIRGLRGLSKKFNILNSNWVMITKDQKIFDLSTFLTSFAVSTPED